ncbi:hypothetical protein UFOVP733_33 [uncultured Caudovirales phage]|uniref:Uncharacterized protein n=1 Tax=uncultured Caudovirales phage TaxID=2100421 RepID=A0A6J5NQY1_9CAUD|nr:hypothetical protein UFOVP733_33 [uncultured Caudovirales phage]CAB5224889.1 hypothetical protein UFOVP743_26 [uncultured Caudovirales phage]
MEILGQYYLILVDVKYPECRTQFIFSRDDDFCEYVEIKDKNDRPRLK